MGYNSRIKGSLQFTPELADVEDVDALSNDFNNLGWAGEFTTEGWDTWHESGKLYDLDTEVPELVGRLAALGSVATGTLLVIGEDPKDISRYVFKDGTVVHETVKVVWPDGTELEDVY